MYWMRGKDDDESENLFEVDWSKIPAPTDDGAAAHLEGMTIRQSAWWRPTTLR